MSHGLSELTIQGVEGRIQIVLLKCTGFGMSKRGWSNGVIVMLTVPADQEMN